MNFDEYWKNATHWDDPGAIANKAWDAAMKEFKKNPPEGLYQIGERVQILDKDISDDDMHRVGMVVATYGAVWTGNPDKVCRKPAWTPKDGEAVLFEYEGKAYPGVIEDGWVITLLRNGITKEVIPVRSPTKPYKKGCTGKPWDEV